MKCQEIGISDIGLIKFREDVVLLGDPPTPHRKRVYRPGLGVNEHPFFIIIITFTSIDTPTNDGIN